MKATSNSTQRIVAYFVYCTLVWGQIAPLARAAETDIDDIPMATQGRAKPNMMLVVDESGSMDWEFLPQKGFMTNDGAAWWNYDDRSFTSRDINNQFVLTTGTPPAGPPNFNPSGFTGTFWDTAGTAPAATRTWYKFQYLFPNGACTSGTCDVRTDADWPSYGLPIPNTREFAWFRSNLFNAQYYNPAINYDPWRPYNDGTTTYTPKNYDNTGSGLPWTAVRSHPHFPTPTSTGTNVNLTADVPQPGDSASLDKTFRLYPGMILPPNACYRVYDWQDWGTRECRVGGWPGAVPGWSNNDSNHRCIMVSGSEAINNTTCPNANAYGVTNRINIGTGPFNWSTYAYVEAQIAYYPATYWIASTGTGALAADEAWGPDPTPPYAATRIRRVEIRSTTTSYPKAVTRNDCAGSSCTYAEEMTNFSNWYAYYRKRHMMMNGALGLALDQARGMRVGAVAFNSPVNPTMYDLDNTTDSANGKRVMGTVIPWKFPNGTPTRQALSFAGEQFRRTDAGAPITAACQYNAAFVITDGFANTAMPSITYGNVDAAATNRFNISYSTTNPALNLTTASPPGVIPPSPAPLPATTVTPGSPFVDSFSNTLADISMYYYSNNLRPDLTFRKVPLDINDLAPDADRNDFLHMNTFALGLGVTGTIFGRTDTADLIRWNLNPHNTTAPMLNWGAVDTTTLTRDPRSVDELWHATINGRGIMLSASSPEETRSAVEDIVNNIGAKGGAGAAVAVSNPQVIAGDNFSYASSYNSGSWSGDINKFTINTTTAIVSDVGIWSPSPQKQLANRDPNSRVIVTFNGSTGVPFRWSNIASSQQAQLNNDPLMLDFLRGDRSKEVEKFRSRGPRIVAPATTWPGGITPNNISVLGDIINSEPVIVAAPRRNYVDDNYAAYKTAQASRTQVVYQGANDGMMHAFAADTGSELWAYVPGHVYPTLANLSSRSGFNHRYYVDGTPRAADVNFGTTASPNWKTILVGGLRKGGRGFFALDVTNPATAAEATIASRALWEFPNSTTPSLTIPKIGFSYARPIIAKTRAAGWVVIVTSGYNNGTGTQSTGGDGKGYVWVLNATTGAVIKEMTTNVGTASTPSGLAYLTGFYNNPDIDPTIEAVYGGDLLGNVWKFDLSGASTSSWGNGQQVAVLKDAANATQPITSEVEVSTNMAGDLRTIFVGTGQYLGDTDVAGNAGATAEATRKHSFYGIREILPTVNNRSLLVQQTISKGSTTATVTSNAVADNAPGWVVDFTEAGERTFVRPTLTGGVLIFPSTIPVGGASAACIAGGRSWVWIVDAMTGGTVAGYTGTTGRYLGETGVTAYTVIQLPSGNRHGIGRTWDQGQDETGALPNTSSNNPRRMTWREVPQ